VSGTRLTDELESERMKIRRLSFVSLFSGAGGLDLGLEAAGFESKLCVEIDPDARQTLQLNRPAWPIAEPGDIHLLEASGIKNQSGLQPGELDLLAGGPPCQPFSKSAYWHSGDTRRLKDPRARTLDAYLDTVRILLPRVLLIENVKGIAYASKDDGVRVLREGLSRINRTKQTNYKIQIVHVNAAEFGVPQTRERVFLIADREGREFVPPPPTHGPSGKLEPYMTAWDAIGDLDGSEPPLDCALTGKWADLLASVPEGQNYLWHTSKGGGWPLFGWRTRYWSFLLKLAKDRPAWTIQAAPGPATGPFHWRNRRLSNRELCRLQTFPDDFDIVGPQRSVVRQVGNAVPCLLGEVLGRQIRMQFFARAGSIEGSLRHFPRRSKRCPPPEVAAPVPDRYKSLAGLYDRHPGEGLGPGRRAST
jgi:DNA (cytosine-5)-methyltransferase 1